MEKYLKPFYALLLCLGIHAAVFAQTPDAFNYQAVLRGNNGEVLAEKSIALRFYIMAGEGAEETTYQELHYAVTDSRGHVALEVGTGIPEFGTMDGVDWGGNTHFLEIEMDPKMTGEFVSLGTQKLNAVPYALHAKTVDNDQTEDADADPENEIQSLRLIGDTLYLSNSNYVVLNGMGASAVGNDSLGGDGRNADNLGDHSATQNLDMSGNWITNSSFDEGIFVDPAGQVGIGTSTPNGLLDLKSFENNLDPANGSCYYLDIVNDYPETGPFPQPFDNDFSTSFIFEAYLPASWGFTNRLMYNFNPGEEFEIKTIRFYTEENTTLTDISILYYYQDGSPSGGGAEIIRNTDLTSPVTDININATSPCKSISILFENNNTMGTLTPISLQEVVFLDDQGLPPSNSRFNVAHNGEVTINDAYSFPTTDGTNNQVLQTDGTGQLTWTDNPDSDNQTLSLTGTSLSITDGNSIDMGLIDTDTDDQTLSLTGTTLTIADGNSIDIGSIDTDTDDQTLSLTGTTLTIADGNSIDIGSIDTDTDDQTLSLTGTTLTIADGNSIDIGSINTDTDDQTLSLSGTTLIIAEGNSVDIGSIDTDTDDQTLSLSGTSLTIVDGNSVDLSSINTDDQNLVLSGNDLSISGGNQVDLSSIGLDNLGNHTATQNLQLGGYYLGNDGNDEGIKIGPAGNVEVFSDNAGSVFEVKKNAGPAFSPNLVSNPSGFTESNFAPPYSAQDLADGFVLEDGVDAGWFVPFPAGSSGEWVQYDFGAGNEKTIEQYVLYWHSYVYQNPTQWTFEGSNDASSWTVLDTQTETHDPSGTITSKAYEFTNSTAFRYYRINITAVNGDNSLILFEVEMMERLPQIEGLFSVNNTGEVTVNSAYTFPTGSGSANQILQTDGSGNTAWTTFTDTDTDDQTLSLSGTTLTIADGNSVDLNSLGNDNLGNHTASQNIQLNGKWISGDGADEGLHVGNDGGVGIGRPSSGALFQVGYENIMVSSSLLTDPAAVSTDSEIPPGFAADAITDAGFWGTAIGVPVTWQYDFGSPLTQPLSQYTLVGTGAATPTAWSFEGSNDNTSWTTLDSQTGQTLSTDLAAPSVYPLNASAGLWQYYRVRVTDAEAPAEGGTTVQIKKIAMMQSTDLSEEFLSVSTAGQVKVNNAYTLPATDGASAQILQTDGAGNVSWSNSTDTDDQTLALSGTTLSIADGNSVDLNGLGNDNMGNHTASQNIQLNGKWISGDGGDEGLQVDNNGDVGIGRAVGSAGYTQLEQYGPANNAAGPHYQAVTSTDDHPVFQQLNWNHDNIGLNFDMYFDGSWKSAHAGSNFSIYKLSNMLRIFASSGNAVGGNVPLQSALTIASSRKVGINHDTPAYLLTLGGGIENVMGVENGSSLAAKNSTGSYETYLWPRWVDNCMYMNYGTGGFNIRNNASTPVMFMTHAGNVGIGTTTPTSAKVQIDGFQNAIIAYGYLNSSGGTGAMASTSNAYSLYASHRIAASEFNAFSDRRIKNVKGISDNAADLSTLMDIEITDYTMIDTISEGNEEYKKVIAQQVKEVFPQAVEDNITRCIPDIYTLASIEEGWIPVATDLKAGDTVKLIFEDGEEMATVEEVALNRFKVSCDKAGKVFVFGRQVEDFHVVDYEALSTLNISATQALAKRLLETESQVQQLLQAQNQSQAQVEKLSQLVESLLSENNTLSQR